MSMSMSVTTATTTSTTISSLGRQALSVVLSYLEENEGTSLMLCKRTWTRNLLPVFRLPDEVDDEVVEVVEGDFHRGDERPSAGLVRGADGTPSQTDAGKGHGGGDNGDAPIKVLRRGGSGGGTTGRLRIRQHRHRFIVVPVPDPTVRLARLNTRRYRRRRRLRLQRHQRSTADMGPDELAGMTTQQMARHEFTLSVGSPIGGGDGQMQVPPPPQMLLSPPLLQFHRPSLGLRAGRGRSLFLTGTTLLASYPRSGNTLLRGLLESVTGCVTGSDTRPDRPLSMALADHHGLVGEGVVTCNTVPLTKTHWPERVGCQRYDVSRVVLLVRNPFDAFDSYWHLNLTNTHTSKVTDDVTHQHGAFYRDMVRNEMKVWSAFLDYYNAGGGDGGRRRVPLLWVRYEDLVRDPAREVERILTFCTEDDWWRTRLDMFVGQQQRHGSGGRRGRRRTNNHNDDDDPSKWGSCCCAHEDLDAAGAVAAPLSQQRSHHHGYRPSSAAGSVGGSLRKQRYDTDLLQELHDMDESGGSGGGNGNGNGGWLERLGYHVYRQGFPNNLDSLPPLPPAGCGGNNSNNNNNKGDDRSGGGSSISLTINSPLSHELRTRDCPFGRNMRDWRREHTDNDTRPFPTVP